MRRLSNLRSQLGDMVTRAVPNISGLSHSQSEILTYAGLAAMVLLVAMNVSKGQVVRPAGFVVCLIMLGLGTPVLMYVSKDGPMDVMKNKGCSDRETAPGPHPADSVADLEIFKHKHECRLFRILGDRYLLGSWAPGERAGAGRILVSRDSGGIMSVSLSLLHKVHALSADFHSIDRRLGREWGPASPCKENSW